MVPDEIFNRATRESRQGGHLRQPSPQPTGHMIQLQCRSPFLHWLQHVTPFRGTVGPCKLICSRTILTRISGSIGTDLVGSSILGDRLSHPIPPTQ